MAVKIYYSFGKTHEDNDLFFSAKFNWLSTFWFKEYIGFVYQNVWHIFRHLTCRFSAGCTPASGFVEIAHTTTTNPYMGDISPRYRTLEAQNVSQYN